jgi:hypothetical protein
LQEDDRLHIVRVNRTVRSAAFAYCVLTIGLYLWGRDAGMWAWSLLVLQFIVYPHLVYWRAIRSARPVRAEIDNLFSIPPSSAPGSPTSVSRSGSAME